MARTQFSIGIMTSSNGNVFHVIGHLWGESTGQWWIPLAKANDAELRCLHIEKPVNYDVTVMDACLSQGLCYQTIFRHYIIFPIFQNYENTGYLLIISFIFDRCRHSIAALTFDKYERDSRDYSLYFFQNQYFPWRHQAQLGGQFQRNWVEKHFANFKRRKLLG